MSTLEQKRIAHAKEALSQYEANMAVEDMYLSDAERDRIHRQIEAGISREEALDECIEQCRAEGLIPSAPLLAAE